MAQSFLWAPLPGGPRRSRAAIVHLVVHRIQVSQEDPGRGDRPRDIAEFFLAHPIGRAASGGAVPYPLVVSAAGHVCQLLPLLLQTPHAAAHNPTSIGIAAVGDFRGGPPGERQWQALVALAAAVLAGLGRPTSALVAHDQLAGGSRRPDKICPGEHLSLARLRAAVAGAGVHRAGHRDLAW